MSFKFISHQSFPDDPYLSEIVYLSLDDKYRVAYVHKEMKNGNKFWSVMQAAAQVGQEKKYFPAIEFDSNFLEKDIKRFLENREWEQNKVAPARLDYPISNVPTSYALQPQLDMFEPGECPF